MDGDFGFSVQSNTNTIFVLGMMLAAIMVNYASVTALTAVVDYPKGFLVPYSPGCFKKGLGTSPQRRH